MVAASKSQEHVSGLEHHYMLLRHWHIRGSTASKCASRKESNGMGAAALGSLLTAPMTSHRHSVDRCSITCARKAVVAALSRFSHSSLPWR
jgi:hypothetical protein